LTTNQLNTQTTL